MRCLRGAGPSPIRNVARSRSACVTLGYSSSTPCFFQIGLSKRSCASLMKFMQLGLCNPIMHVSGLGAGTCRREGPTPEGSSATMPEEAIAIRRQALAVRLRMDVPRRRSSPPECRHEMKGAGMRSSLAPLRRYAESVRTRIGPCRRPAGDGTRTGVRRWLALAASLVLCLSADAAEPLRLDEVAEGVHVYGGSARMRRTPET